MNALFKSIVGGQIRALLTGAAGYMIASGYLNANDSQMIIAGAMALFGAVWSAIEKVRKS